VSGAEAYRLLSADSAPGPYTAFKEYHGAPFAVPQNVATLQGLIEGKIHFIKVVSGTADGEFEAGGSPVAVVIPSKAVRTGVNAGPPASTPLVESYDETFCRISWEPPGNGQESTGPAASHFAVGYRCGTTPLTIYPVVFTSNTATINVPFTMGLQCRVSLHISASQRPLPSCVCVCVCVCVVAIASSTPMRCSV